MTQIVKISNRKFFREINFLHYNKPKKLWTYFSDLFAFSIVVLAITGLFMVKGKKGIGGRSIILISIGIMVPLLFLMFYLWT
ncbi:MAG: PepSY-associated TM helix domain-containing protein [Bacteroidales bacterium]